MNNPRPIVDVNLLPDSRQGRRPRGRKMLLILALVVAFALMPVLYHAVSSSMGKNSDLRSQLEMLDQDVAIRQATVDRQAGMVSLTKGYEIISGKRGVITEHLTAICGAAEEAGIDISSIWHAGKGGSVLVSCQATGHSRYDEMRNAFESFCEALEQTGQFLSIIPPKLDYPAISIVQVEIQTEKMSPET